MKLDPIIDLIEKSGYHFEEAMIFPDEAIPFWHSSIMDSKGNSISSGFGAEKFYARKIAIAEYLERRHFREIANGPETIKKKWGIPIISTACGFAGGFDRKNAILRSLGEAAERWVMSKWIDDGFYIQELHLHEIEKELDPVSKFIVRKFDRVLFYRHTVSFNFGNLPIKVEVGQTMGLSDEGIFPGSSAQILGGSVWQHALVESFRHFLFVKNNPRRPGRFPDDKIHYFASNASVALNRIQAAENIHWPNPELILQADESFLDGSFFLSRSIFGGWKSWNEGPIERFLY
ncbi:MAG: hypothetical protein EOO18_08245 [Chryseobacterium sp.]|nr:MAG: hypothetical protein EOO18_08245 [Chryseobacterium sp.]